MVLTLDEKIETQAYMRKQERNRKINSRTFIFNSILKLFEKNPKEFEHIASLPSKIRTSVNVENESCFYFGQEAKETSN